MCSSAGSVRLCDFCAKNPFFSNVFQSAEVTLDLIEYNKSQVRGPCCVWIL